MKEKQVEKTKKKIEIYLANQLCGNVGEDTNQCMSRALGLELTSGNM